MPLAPSWFERLAFGSNLAPAVILDFLGAQAFRVLAAAHRLGVFEALAGGPLTAPQVALRIRADDRATALLLEGLETVGYVEARSGRYAATAMTARWLSALGPGLGFFEMLLERLGDLEESVRRGGPAIDARAWLDGRPNGWRLFQGMVAMAHVAGDEVVSKVKLRPTALRLLDVGGGHGLYSVKFCRRNPRLSATVFDLPQTLEAAKATISSESMCQRVSTQPGDFSKDDLGSGYDVALLFNIVHGLLPEKNAELLRKVAGALNPGGQVVILDQLAGRQRGATSRAVAALTGLTLFAFSGGRTYRFEEIAGWLQATGFASPRRLWLARLPGSALVVGTKVPPGA
jgi:2-polyprenyl-3-methyl-5-hydroxy-6-metoxy-1,4-benzoquinol methylase